MYVVSVSRSAQKETRSLDRPMIPRIMEAIRGLSTDPRPSGCKKLVGSRDLWRVRVGEYRVVYRIDDAEKTLEIVLVRHRSDAYD